MCDTPAGARPSGSNSSKAKLLVPSGTFDQASGGEMFSPTQFGVLCLSLHAFFVARAPLSGTADDDSVNTSAARTTGTAKRDAPRNPLAVSRLAIVRVITFLPLGLSGSGRPRLLRRQRRLEASDLSALGVRHRLGPPAVFPFAEQTLQPRHHMIGKQLGVIGSQFLAHAAELQEQHQVADIE